MTIPESYKQQDGCHNCGNCLQLQSPNCDAEYYCAYGETSRPHVTSTVGPDGRYNEEMFKARDKVWTPWADAREVCAWGRCGLWIQKTVGQRPLDILDVALDIVSIDDPTLIEGTVEGEPIEMTVNYGDEPDPAELGIEANYGEEPHVPEGATGVIYSAGKIIDTLPIDTFPEEDLPRVCGKLKKEESCIGSFLARRYKREALDNPITDEMRDALKDLYERQGVVTTTYKSNLLLRLLEINRQVSDATALKDELEALEYEWSMRKIRTGRDTSIEMGRRFLKRMNEAQAEMKRTMTKAERDALFDKVVKEHPVDHEAVGEMVVETVRKMQAVEDGMTTHEETVTHMHTDDPKMKVTGHEVVDDDPLTVELKYEEDFVDSPLLKKMKEVKDKLQTRRVRELQRAVENAETHHPIPFKDYQKFEWFRDELAKEGIDAAFSTNLTPEETLQLLREHRSEIFPEPPETDEEVIRREMDAYYIWMGVADGTVEQKIKAIEEALGGACVVSHNPPPEQKLAILEDALCLRQGKI